VAATLWPECSAAIEPRVKDDRLPITCDPKAR
jgi:hypothetical protein